MANNKKAMSAGTGTASNTAIKSRHSTKLQHAMAVVSIRNNRPMTSSMAIADRFGRAHKNVLQSVEKLLLSGALNRLEIKPINYLDSRGREQPAYELSERAALIAMPWIGGKQAERGQVILVDAFLAARDEINRIRTMHTSPEWQQARLESKSVRHTLTDTIAAFVQYATERGSKGAKLYYMNFSKAVNQSLFFVESLAGKSLRDQLDANQLAKLVMAEHVAERSIIEGMATGKPYKEIFRVVASRVRQFAELVGQSAPGAATHGH